MTFGLEAREKLKQRFSGYDGWRYRAMSYLRLARAELSVAACKTLQTDRELDITRGDDVLDLELRELGIKAELLDDTYVSTCVTPG